jgi:hypothetical protein
VPRFPPPSLRDKLCKLPDFNGTRLHSARRSKARLTCDTLKSSQHLRDLEIRTGQRARPVICLFAVDITSTKRLNGRFFILGRPFSNHTPCNLFRCNNLCTLENRPSVTVTESASCTLFEKQPGVYPTLFECPGCAGILPVVFRAMTAEDQAVASLATRSFACRPTPARMIRQPAEATSCTRPKPSY